MTDNLRELNVAIYNDVVTRLDAAQRMVEQGHLLEALAEIEDAESRVARLPLLDAADVGLQPDVMLRKGDVLAALGREDEALLVLQRALEAIRLIVRNATDGAADLDLVACNRLRTFRTRRSSSTMPPSLTAVSFSLMTRRLDTPPCTPPTSMPKRMCSQPSVERCREPHLQARAMRSN